MKINGYKTYIAAGLLALFAITGAAIGKIDGTEAIQMFLEAAGIAGLRHGFGTPAQKK